MGFCYLNGEFLEDNKAAIPILQLGVQRGFGIFDLFRTRNEKPTFLSDYLDRFENSQQFLGLSKVITRDEIEETVSVLQRKNQYRNSTFKLMLFGDGTDDSDLFDPFFYILNYQLPDDLAPIPSKLISWEYQREFPEIKSLNYFNSYRLHHQKKKAGAADVLYHHQGVISETSRSNVFVVKDGVISTPNAGMLHGISRKNLLRNASNKYEFDLGEVALEEVYAADEVFVSSTLKQVTPIVSVDGKEIGNGKVGEVTKEIQKIWFEMVRG